MSSMQSFTSRIIRSTEEYLTGRGRVPVAAPDLVQPEASGRLGSRFDHTLLKPEAGGGAFRELCDQALSVEAASVCVPSSRVAEAASRLAGSSVRVCTVIGFPVGYGLRAGKVAEARAACDDGADELDMVVNIGAVIDGNLLSVYDDVAALVHTVGCRTVKVILETAALNESQIVGAGAAALFAGASYLKTSTGFSAAGGASEEAVALLRSVCGSRARVKASGGIRSLESARAMIAAGADRIGASATLAILEAAGDTPKGGFP